MSNDPWKDLAPPNAADAINARRVDADIPWGFFWARGVDHKCLLVLQHATDSTPHGRLPKLKGIEVTVSEASGDGDHMLVFRLLDSAHRDIFHRLCTDIIASASGADSEKEAVEVALARTWRWHHLLRGGGDGGLSAEEQKGLIGELLVMERYLLPQFPALDAVSAWHGPLGAPKDFEVGRVCIEAKARRGAATPYIAISSEHQLDDSGTDALFLHLVELDQAPSDTSDGFSVSDVATRVRGQIAKADNNAVFRFDELLSAAGFRWEDDYSDWQWIEGLSRQYRVSGDFPRITAQMVFSGVSNVKYSIAVAECEAFLAADGELEVVLRGRRHGD
ncbi:MAG: PD-(D/E)XK motif protein [Armatimonadota bacterium]|nr:PD-(D/E)XK motif protein [Armatimonadota bacterium]